METISKINELQLVEIMVKDKGDIIVYAHLPGCFSLYRFSVARNGEVKGSSRGDWLPLSGESSAVIRGLVKKNWDKVPVYFCGIRRWGAS